MFFNPLDGSLFPLSPYYQKNNKFYSFDDALPIIMNADVESFYHFQPLNYYESVLDHYHKYDKHLKMLEVNSNPILNY